MTEHGYILLNRKLVAGDDEWWEGNEPFDKRSAWIDLLFFAQWKAGHRVIDGVRVALARGELVASLRFLAARWRWTVKSVRGWLEQAERLGRIRAQRRAHDGAHAPTIYLVVNYSRYNTVSPKKGTRKVSRKGTPRAHEGHTKGTKKMKENTKEVTTTSYSPDFEAAWAAYPKRPNNSKPAAYRTWRARLAEGVTVDELLAGTRAYRAFTDREGTSPRFVKLAATFYGPDRHYSNDYGTPVQPIRVYDPVTGDMTPEFARAAGMR